MTQVVVRLPDDLAARLDALVEDGVVASKSAALREGLERLLDERRREQRRERDIEAYARMPQTEEELEGLDESTARMIAAEPW